MTNPPLSYKIIGLEFSRKKSLKTRSNQTEERRNETKRDCSFSGGSAGAFMSSGFFDHIKTERGTNNHELSDIGHG